MKQKIKLSTLKNFISWTLLILLLAAKIFLAVETGASGENFNSLEDNKESLLRENKSLEEEIALSSSLKQIEESSGQLGFIKQEKFIYITLEENVANIR